MENLHDTPDTAHEKPVENQNAWAEAVANGETVIFSANESPDPWRIARIVKMTRQNRINTNPDLQS